MDQKAFDFIPINNNLHEKKDEDIHKISSDIIIINEIMKDLSTLVNNQQDDIKNIDNNIDITNVHTENGLEQVKEADRINKNRCIIL